MHDDLVHEPTVEVREAASFVAVPVVARMSDIDDVGVQAERDLFEQLTRLGIEATYPVFWEYLSIDMDDELRLRVGVRVEEAPHEAPGLEVGTHPGGSYLTLVHQGDPGELYSVTSGFLEWAEKQHIEWDRSATDPNGWTCRLEEYLTDPAVEPDRAAWRTRLAFKILGDGNGETPDDH